MQVPILNGLYADDGNDLRTSIPVNMVAVPKDVAISAGYMKTMDGIVEVGKIDGTARGSIVWKKSMYAVYGDALYVIGPDNKPFKLGNVSGAGPVRMAHGYDYLGIVTSINDFYLYDGSRMRQVTDPDLGEVFDIIWVDGYYMLTDGEYIIITELNDPFSIDPLKYGSAETDPDDIVGIEKLRNEVYAIGRYSIETFDNVGGSLFPFQRIEGARIGKGAVGTDAKCNFGDEAIAFVGSGENESISVYLAANGGVQRIATREIDEILAEYTEDQLSKVVVRPVIDKGHRWVMVYLPDRCIVYDQAASQILSKPAWFELSSGMSTAAYAGMFPTFCYNAWYLFADSMFGKWTNKVHSHFGQQVSWQFGTNMLYNESMGAIIHEMELVCITANIGGEISPKAEYSIFTQYSLDGRSWSQLRPCSAGKPGETRKRLRWLKQGKFDNYRLQRFAGTSDTPISVIRLEMRLEPLNG